MFCVCVMKEFNNKVTKSEKIDKSIFINFFSFFHIKFIIFIKIFNIFKFINK